MPTGKSLAKLSPRHAVIAAVGVFVLAATVIWSRVYVRSFEGVRSRFKPSDVWIVDRNGLPLESIRVKNNRRSLEWTRWADVSPAFQNLLVRAEDRRFYSHPGVDIIALATAARDRITGRSRRGGSTLSMQLVGLLNGDSLSSRRTIWQKWGQIVSALKLDSQWSKDQILEAYINLVPFRGELVGLRAASLGYFGKNPSGLVENEAALLVSLLRSPNSAPDQVGARACFLLRRKDCGDVRTLATEVLSEPYQLARSREMVPVLSNSFVEGKDNPSLIRTSLDYRIQGLAMRALQEQLIFLREKNVNDGAVLVLETKTGRVVAYAANSGAGSASADQIDGVRMRRQAGSTMKPFVYATAFDWRLLKPTSLIEDSPADISVSLGRVYHPKNYDRTFRGLVSAGEALGSSINVAAVRALQMVGEPRVLDRLRALGFKELQDDEYYGPSLALGAIDVSLWELTQGYRQFATEESPFSKPTRLSIFNILASPEYRRFTFGMDSLLTLPFPAAVKTGTSKDMRDNWCIGWTSQYTVGVWVGNFSGAPMWNVSGMSGAAPVWRTLMMALHPNAPAGTLGKYEKPSEPLPRHTLSRIRYPAPDMLVGIDPDIPRPVQKLPIEIENPQPGQKVFLNDQLLSKAQETTFWPLKPGSYRVELKAENDQVIDSVKFQVR